MGAGLPNVDLELGRRSQSLDPAVLLQPGKGNPSGFVESLRFHFNRMRDAGRGFESDLADPQETPPTVTVKAARMEHPRTCFT